MTDGGIDIVAKRLAAMKRIAERIDAREDPLPEPVAPETDEPEPEPSD